MVLLRGLSLLDSSLRGIFLCLHILEEWTGYCFYNYHVVIIIGLISRFRTSFLFGVTGFWFLFLVDLAKVELDIGPVGAHVEFLYEELIVGPVIPVQDFSLEVVVEYPLVLGVLYIRLHLCLGGVWLRLPPDAEDLSVAHIL